MYKLRTNGGKRNLVKNWALPERVFYACGACHILAYAFLNAYPDAGFSALWIRPTEGYTGNHIVVVRDKQAFDYHGYSNWPALFAHIKRKANRWWPGWNAELIELPKEVLVSEVKSRTFDGLWLREPTQYMYDALPRANRYLQRYPIPTEKYQ